MEYQYIVNPATNRKCRVDTALGKRIIKNYANTITGGGKNKTGAAGGAPGAAELKTVNIQVDKRLLKLSNKVQAQDLLNKMAMTLYGKPIDECLGKAQNLVKGWKKLRVIVHLPPNLSEDKSVVDKMIAEEMREQLLDARAAWSRPNWEGKKHHPTWRDAAAVVERQTIHPDARGQASNSYQAIIRMESIANHHNREAGEGSTVFVNS